MRPLVALVALTGLCAASSPVADSVPGADMQAQQILVFTKTAGFRHRSIPAGVEALRGIAARLGLTFVHTEDAATFTDAGLAPFAAVVFLSTTGDVLDDAQQSSFERFIRSGRGFVGIHAASDTEYEWPWYGRLVGAWFDGHPAVQQATLDVVVRDHAATRHLPARWTRTDEWYDFRALNPDVQVLITIDESSYEGAKTGSPHPMAWSHQYDGGRAFYTAGGHSDASFGEADFVDHIAGGLSWVLQAGTAPTAARTEPATQARSFIAARRCTRARPYRSLDRSDGP